MMNVDKDKCIGCGLCVKDCFVRDIELTDGKAKINNVTCFKCGHCVAVCPKNAVSSDEYNMEDVKDYNKEEFSIDAENLLNFIKFRRTIRHFKNKDVGVEKLSKITDWKDRNTAVLFGDGAGAVVMGRVSEGRGILSFELGADGVGAKHLYQDEYIIMNGREVFKFAVRQMADSSVNVIEQAGLTKDDVDFLIPHQANIRIMEASRQRLELPEEKMSKTIKKYGNTSSSSIPIAMAEEWEAGKIKDDDVIVMVGFGGGLTWGAICMRWGR